MTLSSPTMAFRDPHRFLEDKTKVQPIPQFRDLSAL